MLFRSSIWSLRSALSPMPCRSTSRMGTARKRWRSTIRWATGGAEPRVFRFWRRNSRPIWQPAFQPDAAQRSTPCARTSSGWSRRQSMNLWTYWLSSSCRLLCRLPSVTARQPGSPASLPGSSIATWLPLLVYKPLVSGGWGGNCCNLAESLQEMQ